MTEHEIRALVREAVARHLGQEVRAVPAGPPAWRTHPSHGRFVVVTGKDADGPCLIESVTPCSHCGYCQSYGH